MAQGSPEWLDRRAKHAITWSEAANALGVGYDSPAAYMKRKLGLVEEKESNWRMLEGQRREPWAAELYLRIMGWCGDEVEFEIENFRSDWQDHRLGGSPDRIVRSKKTGERWLLEIKTCPGGDMRTEIPVSHLLQMHGLLHTYKLEVAHYFCWSQSQGILIAEVTYDPRLWAVLYPRYRAFADLWALRQVPARTKTEEKEFVKEAVTRFTHITEISCVTTKKLQQELWQTPPERECSDHD